MKVIRKLLNRKKEARKQLPTRITNDTVAQHREKVLAGGRKHKYPVQYTKHRLVWNTVIISGIVLAAIVGLVWMQLYVFRSTGDVTYRITRLFPLPVARIDGEYVRYSDYLLYQRSTLASQQNSGRGESADKAAFQRQQAMQRALENAYVKKIARQRNISISDEQVNQAVERLRKASDLSEAAYADVVSEQLKFSMDEMRQVLRSVLLRQAVAFAVDQSAAKTASTVSSLIKEGKSLEEISQQLGESVQFVPEVSVPKDNSDGGLSETASKTKVGEISGSTKTLAGDGYYFVLAKANTGDIIQYAYLKVPLLTLQKNFLALEKSEKVVRYINVD